MFCSLYLLFTLSLLCLIPFKFCNAQSLSGYGWSVSTWKQRDLLFDNVSMPGDIYSIYSANPLWRDNDVKLRGLVDANIGWRFTRKILLNNLNTSTLLHCKGIDTTGELFVNGNRSGSFNNQFVEYVFDITSLLKQNSENILEFAIKSPTKHAVMLADAYEDEFGYVPPPVCPPDLQHGECSVNQLRKMQSSFAWDWGPSFPTVGLSGDVSLISTNNCAVLHAAVSSIRESAQNSTWTVLTLIEFYCVKENVSVDMNINIPSLRLIHSETRTVGIQRQLVWIKHRGLQVSHDQLWWPRGYGNQTLHSAEITITTGATLQLVQTKVAFRHVDLVEDLVNLSNESDGRTFYFRINDLPIFLKGSNWIPASSFLGEFSCAQVEYYFQSMVAAHFNAIRVWGGGIYEQDCFYDLADKYGILIWQDAMFACFLYPARNETFLALVEEELRFQLKRLHGHPSIIVWAGNNEIETAIATNWYEATKKNCTLFAEDYHRLFNLTVAKVVTEFEGNSVPFLLSSPSNGRVLTSAAEYGISKDPGSELFGDIHAYDYVHNSWNVSNLRTPRCTTEYGFQSLPSMLTLHAALADSDLAFNSSMLRHRQHHPQGYEQMIQLASLNGLPRPSSRMNSTDPQRYLQLMIYRSQISQSESIRIQTEHYRQGRFDGNVSQARLDNYKGLTMCAMYWQLNDIWQAPTWSSIDYAGRWKMLHYSAVTFMQDVLLSARQHKDSTNLFVINDEATDLESARIVITLCSFEIRRKCSPVANVSDIKVARLSSKMVYTLDHDILQDTRARSAAPSYYAAQLLNARGQVVNTVNIFVQRFDQLDPAFVGGVSIVSVKTDSKRATVLLETDVAPFTWLELKNDFNCTVWFSDNGMTLTRKRTQITATLAPTQLNGCDRSLDNIMKQPMRVMTLKDLFPTTT